KNGIKDIDIWLFFSPDEKIKMPNIANFRFSRFYNFENFGEIKVDYLKKAIPSDFIKGNSIATIQNYILKSKNSTPSHLRQKAIIGLYPENIFDVIIWWER
ncbi:MAG: hypothetical protein JXA98_07060, partial [Methanosarcinaceae archaeon]|nr:hypothetical protein [Methanosarcinaceae archaeon]